MPKITHRGIIALRAPVAIDPKADLPTRLVMLRCESKDCLGFLPILVSRPAASALDGGMTMIIINSSAIRAVGYDGYTLTVEFHNSGVYDHPGVPYELYAGLMGAASKGPITTDTFAGGIGDVNMKDSAFAEAKAALLAMTVEADELQQTVGGSITDAVAGWLAPRYVLAAREQLAGLEGEDRLKLLRAFVQDWRCSGRAIKPRSGRGSSASGWQSPRETQE